VVKATERRNFSALPGVAVSGGISAPIRDQADAIKRACAAFDETPNMAVARSVIAGIKAERKRDPEYMRRIAPIGRGFPSGAEPLVTSFRWIPSDATKQGPVVAAALARMEEAAGLEFERLALMTRRIFELMGLPDVAAALNGGIHATRGGRGRWQVTVPKLAGYSGISVERARPALAILESFGLVSRFGNAEHVVIEGGGMEKRRVADSFQFAVFDDGTARALLGTLAERRGMTLAEAGRHIPHFMAERREIDFHTATVMTIASGEVYCVLPPMNAAEVASVRAEVQRRDAFLFGRSEKQRRVYDRVIGGLERGEGTLPNARIAEETAVSESTVKRVMADMRAEGILIDRAQEQGRDGSGFKAKVRSITKASAGAAWRALRKLAGGVAELVQVGRHTVARAVRMIRNSAGIKKQRATIEAPYRASNKTRVRKDEGGEERNQKAFRYANKHGRSLDLPAGVGSLKRMAARLARFSREARGFVRRRLKEDGVKDVARKTGHAKRAAEAREMLLDLGPRDTAIRHLQAKVGRYGTIDEVMIAEQIALDAAIAVLEDGDGLPAINAGRLIELRGRDLKELEGDICGGSRAYQRIILQERAIARAEGSVAARPGRPAMVLRILAKLNAEAEEDGKT
jgi:hypothetical protein